MEVESANAPQGLTETRPHVSESSSATEAVGPVPQTQRTGKRAAFAALFSVGAPRFELETSSRVARPEGRQAPPVTDKPLEAVTLSDGDGSRRAGELSMNFS